MTNYEERVWEKDVSLPKYNAMIVVTDYAWVEKNLSTCELYLVWNKQINKQKDYSFTLLAKVSHFKELRVNTLVPPPEHPFD